MNKWQNAEYLINAKKCIDSLIFISENAAELANINLRERVDNIRRNFYINLCFVLDKKYNKDSKKDICNRNQNINRVFYERDKNSAHKDKNYKPRKYETIEQEIDDKKKEIKEVRIVCQNILPEVITLDYVSHDHELFRLINRLNMQIEKDLDLIKYPKGTFHSYQLSEEGRHVFKEFDTEKRDRENAKMLGYDYDDIMSRKLVEKAEDITQMTEEEKTRSAVLFQNGINTNEGLQNLQDSCIKVNTLYNCNMWLQPNIKNVKKVEELKEIGFFDKYEVVHWDILNDPIKYKKYLDILKEENE